MGAWGVEELPAGTTSGAKTVRASPNGTVERRIGDALTPAELALRRRNRRRMGMVAVPAVILGGLALAASILAGTGSNGPQPLDVPSGYQGITDGVFAYSVPATWTQANAYTDDVGDLAIEGTSGWVGEHLGARTSAPVPGEAPPASFQAFGEPQPAPYRMSAAAPARVDDATLAYRYTMTRPGGFHATALDVWQSDGAELWILIHASGPTTAAILGSLRG